MRRELAAVFGVALLSGQALADDPALKGNREQVSYGMGVSMARHLERQGVDVDVELVARGLRDALSGQRLLLGDDELRAVMGRLQGELKARKTRQSRTPAEARADGETFLAENAKREGVVTLPSGLQYKVLRTGEGQQATDADRVVCHYRGSFVDGAEFDSSYGRGRPATFEVARVIPGWREALKLMPVGSKWRLFIPAQLAYGERGARGRRRLPGRIGPNATLIYEMELLAVRPGSGIPSTKTATGPGLLPAPVDLDERDDGSL